MKAPGVLTWLVSVLLGGLGIAGHFVAIPLVTAYAFFFLTGGFILLTLGTMIRGL